MAGLKVANMAAAIWPHLAKDQRQTSEPVRVREAKPDWGKSNDALWSDPPPIPNGLDRVPGLRRVNKR
jgi:hypothetical protein